MADVDLRTSYKVVEVHVCHAVHANQQRTGHLLSKQHDSSDDCVMVCGDSQAAAVLDGIGHDNCLYTGLWWDDVTCLDIT